MLNFFRDKLYGKDSKCKENTNSIIYNIPWKKRTQLVNTSTITSNGCLDLTSHPGLSGHNESTGKQEVGTLSKQLKCGNNQQLGIAA